MIGINCEIAISVATRILEAIRPNSSSASLIGRSEFLQMTEAEYRAKTVDNGTSYSRDRCKSESFGR